MKGTSVHIKDIMELKSSVIIRFEILLWLFGCENVSGPSRNGPLARVRVLGADQKKSGLRDRDCVEWRHAQFALVFEACPVACVCLRHLFELGFYCLENRY